MSPAHGIMPLIGSGFGLIIPPPPEWPDLALTEFLHPIPRQVASQRRAQEKQFDKTLKRAASGSGWRHARGSLFREYCGWFVEVQTIVHRSESRTLVRLHVKPMALDPLYWSIVGLGENRKEPLSFRAHGAWVCRTPTIEETEFADSDTSPEDLARKIFAWADTRLPPIENLGADAFLDLLRHGHCWQCETTLIAALILFGREEEARKRIEEAEGAQTPIVTVISVTPIISTACFPRQARLWLDREAVRPFRR